MSKKSMAFLVFSCFVLHIFCALQARAAADYTKTPVFFVHGHGMSASSWDSMISYLTQSDYPSEYLEAIQLTPNNGANIPAAEEQIAPAVEDLLNNINTFLQQEHPSIPPKTKVDLVSHSMGGLSSRWYTAKVRPDRVRKWVSLAGGNHGTDVDFLPAFCSSPDPGGDDLCPAYAENEQESYIQYTLNGAPHVADVDETPYGIGQDAAGVNSVPSDYRRILYATVRTSPDQWIDPDDSVILDGTGGVSISIPPGVQATEDSDGPGNFLMTNGVGHDAMLSDDDTMELVKVILDCLMPLANRSGIDRSIKAFKGLDATEQNVKNMIIEYMLEAPL